MSCSMTKTATPVAAWISRIRSAVARSLGDGHARGRLVEQEKPRLAREQHRDLQPLFLAVREDAGRLCRVLREAKAREQFPTIAAPGGTAEQTEQAALSARGDQRHLEVLGDREARIDSRHLELARDPEPADPVRRQPGDVASGEADRAGGRREGAGDHVEQGGLAAAIGTDDAAQPAVVDRQAHPAERPHPAERLGDVLDLEQRPPSAADQRDRPGPALRPDTGSAPRPVRCIP